MHMDKKNIVFIARSLDGFIATKEGGIDWLNSIPNPEGDDMGYMEHIENIDALVMGRNTFELVCSFDMEWPYTKPVFVLSNKMQKVPEKFSSHAKLVKGSLTDVLEVIHGQGYFKLYIDGGATIQSFLKEDLIDEMIISTIPILIGGGIPLFGDLPEMLLFEHKGSKVFLDAVVQDTYSRKRK